VGVELCCLDGGRFAVESGRHRFLEIRASHGEVVARSPGLVPACNDGRVDDLTSLALAARGGDRAALASFVRASQPDVWRLCAHLSGRQEADDLTQDVYVRALRSLPSYRGESSARTWLLSIAHRTCVDHVRSAQRRRLLLGRLRAQPSRPEAPSRVGEVDLDVLISALDDDRRAAFVLTQVLGLSYAESAGVLRVPVGTIRSRVARARADLVTAWGRAASG
jgi:RNA polymerase sigma-70 factor (ECF subfamily)